jgi:hypothetical protein
MRRLVRETCGKEKVANIVGAHSHAPNCRIGHCLAQAVN